MKSIFDETEIAGHALKNRIVRSATWESLADANGHATEPLFKLYTDLAAGGVGMIITGMTTAAVDDYPLRGMPGLYGEQFIEENQRITAAVHQHGALILPQLALEGVAYADIFGNRASPTAMSLEIIVAIKQALLDSAIIAQRSGYDGVQLHAGHGWLLSRFLSPIDNQRTDQYGGSPLNRARILLETVEQIRDELGAGFLLSVKINSPDAADDGSQTDDSLSICQALAAAGIDVIEVSGNDASRIEIDTPEDEGYFFPFAQTLADTVDTPVILVGGHRSIDNMHRLLNDSRIEYLSLSRPLLREPNLIKRWAAGDTLPSRCSSCNSCYRIAGHQCKFVKRDRKRLRAG